MMMSPCRSAFTDRYQASSRIGVGAQRLSSQSWNAEAIREFVQSLAQFGAQRYAVGHPLLVHVRRALARQPDVLNARESRGRLHDVPHGVDSLLKSVHVGKCSDVHGHDDLPGVAGGFGVLSVIDHIAAKRSSVQGAGE